MKKLFYLLVIIFLIGRFIFIKGPIHPLVIEDCEAKAELQSFEKLYSYISKENLVSGLKPGNESRVLWADSLSKTDYCFLYIHGFSASPMEGYDLIKSLSDRYDANSLLGRLPGHGIATVEAMAKPTVKDYIQSVKTMVDFASTIGKEIIVVSCSTGSTLSNFIAGCDDRIKAQVMLSPNFGLTHAAFDYIDGPWGLAITKYFNGGPIRDLGYKDDFMKKYWTVKYKVEALIVLDQMISELVNEKVMSRVEQATFIGYYFKDEDHQDPIVDIDKIRKFSAQLGCKDEKLVIQEFAESNHHVIGSPQLNPNYKLVEEKVISFLEDSVIGIGMMPKAVR